MDTSARGDNVDAIILDVFGYGESKVLQNSGAGGTMNMQNAEGGAWTDGEQSFLGRFKRRGDQGNTKETGVSEKIQGVYPNSQRTTVETAAGRAGSASAREGGLSQKQRAECETVRQ